MKNSYTYKYKLFLKMVRIMKLTVILLLAGCLHLSARSFAQQITLQEKDAPIESVFQKISLQSGYHFWYENTTLKSARPVTVVLKNAGLDEALSQTFANQPLTYSIVGTTIVVTPKDEKAPAIINIKGTVTDKDGNPLVGVTVLVKGTLKGTTTDSKGHYTLDAPEDAILVFSYIGFSKQEIQLTGQTQLDVQMQADVTTLPEISINAGYYKVKDQESTGSIARSTGQRNRKPAGK